MQVGCAVPNREPPFVDNVPGSGFDLKLPERGPRSFSEMTERAICDENYMQRECPYRHRSSSLRNWGRSRGVWPGPGSGFLGSFIFLLVLVRTELLVSVGMAAYCGAQSFCESLCSLWQINASTLRDHGASLHGEDLFGRWELNLFWLQEALPPWSGL